MSQGVLMAGNDSQARQGEQPQIRWQRKSETHSLGCLLPLQNAWAPSFLTNIFFLSGTKIIAPTSSGLGNIQIFNGLS